MRKALTVMTIIPVLLVLIMISSFSLQTAEESTNTSNGIVQGIMQYILSGSNSLSAIEIEYLQHNLTFIVRKGAHFFEFALLGAFTYLHLITVHGLKRHLWLWAFLFGALYACFDETLQLFSSGRAGTVTDVIIDSLGTLLGVCILVCLFRITDYLKSCSDRR